MRVHPTTIIFRTRFLAAITASSVLIFPWMPLAANETSGVSATVVKAEFETSEVFVEFGEEVYRLTVQLVNAGGLNAKTVSVFVLYPETLAYEEGIHQRGTITTQGSSLGQWIEWGLEDVQAGTASSLTLTFRSHDEARALGETSFSVSIVSPVSIPVIRKVTMGADRGAFGAKPDRLQTFINAFAIRYYSFKRWFFQRIFGRE